MTHDLLAAVDALTKPITDRQPEGSPKQGETIKRAPLLAQLRSAIASDLTVGGGKSLPNQRIPINAVALHMYDRIEKAITDAYRDVSGRPPALYPEEVLRAWYIVFEQSNPRDEIRDEWTARINGWVGEIERMFDPPKTCELVDTPCILCGKAEVIDSDGNLTTAVIVEYRHDDSGMRIESTICRACKNVWDGEHGASSFRRYADEQAEATTLYEHEIPHAGLKYREASAQALEAFEQAGTLYGRMRLKSAPTVDDPVWRFTANLRDTQTFENVA